MFASKFAQASQTDSGIKFHFIKYPKTRHPAQKPTIDSRNANPASTARTIRYGRDESTTKKRINAIREKINPTNWANLFGGPATGRFLPMMGTSKRVAIWPMGLKVGPVATRAQNP